MSVASAPTDDAAFRRIAEAYRHDIQVHCYRMLGSIHDAEDAAQETLLRAWRGLDGFEGRAPLRAWLYRVATNVCLTTLAGRARRVVPEALGPAVEFAPLGTSDREVRWLEPYPDALLEGVADEAPGPEARYELRESVRLAFISAIQRLPPRQRAVLLLRDVLGFTARETAEQLGSSVASVNSALQRARTTLAERRPADAAPSEERERLLLERYVAAWQSADVDGLVRLMKDDAVFTMPPWREWYVGRARIRSFLAWAFGRRRGQRLVATRANGQPAFGYYRSDPDAGRWRAFGIQVLAVEAGALSVVTTFVDPALFGKFGLADEFPLGRESP